jgi:hypothetical protein
LAGFSASASAAALFSVVAAVSVEEFEQPIRPSVLMALRATPYRLKRRVEAIVIIRITHRLYQSQKPREYYQIGQAY